MHYIRMTILTSFLTYWRQIDVMPWCRTVALLTEFSVRTSQPLKIFICLYILIILNKTKIVTEIESMFSLRPVSYEQFSCTVMMKIWQKNRKLWARPKTEGLVFRTGCGILLNRFLIIAFSSTLVVSRVQNLLENWSLYEIGSVAWFAQTSCYLKFKAFRLYDHNCNYYLHIIT